MKEKKEKKIEVGIENRNLSEVMDKLEALEEVDEARAIQLLKQFNELSSKMAKLVMNTDASLSHEEWQKKCDQANKDLEALIKMIKES